MCDKSSSVSSGVGFCESRHNSLKEVGKKSNKEDVTMSSHSYTLPEDCGNVRQGFSSAISHSVALEGSPISRARENQESNFLHQLSNACSKRLHEEANEVRNSDSQSKRPKLFDCDTQYYGHYNQNNINVERDMLGNCLHSSNVQTTKNLPPSSLSKKKISSSDNRDRSNLRKGKWTPEEEEYTSRIIHHFRSGLLNLPEGTTLRSYIAQKLNCDPMRITKKFAGASCLGKGMYHLHERSQMSLHDIEVANTELNELERRFRLRVEEGNCHHILTTQSTSLLLNEMNNTSSPHNLQNATYFPVQMFNQQPVNFNSVDPALLAKYASALGASVLGTPGVSAFVIQLIASQQMQQYQSQFQQQSHQSQQPQDHLQSMNNNNLFHNTKQNHLQISQQSQETSQLQLKQLNQRRSQGSNVQESAQVQKGSQPKIKIQSTNLQNNISNSSPCANSYGNQSAILSTEQGQPRHQPKEANSEKHSKEDVDAGNTLLGFLRELRKNHEEAIAASDLQYRQENKEIHKATIVIPKNRFNNYNETNEALDSPDTVEGSASVSTVGLISETTDDKCPLRHDYYYSSSSLSGDMRSHHGNKDDSSKDESSHESGSQDVSSEDDKKTHVMTGFNGPMRKRFRNKGKDRREMS